MNRTDMTGALRAFWRRTDGTGPIEVLFGILLLNMLFSAFYIWWGSYRDAAQVDRTTYTVSDLVSRQRGTVLQRSLLDGLERTAEFILDEDLDAALRFTHVTRVEGEPDDPTGLRIDWSYSPCGSRLSAADDPDFDLGALPQMTVGVSMIVTEMRVPRESSFDLIPAIVLERRITALPRFEQRFTLEGEGTTTCQN